VRVVVDVGARAVDNNLKEVHLTGAKEVHLNDAGVVSSELLGKRSLVSRVVARAAGVLW
jgi:hypothetical protein